MKTLSLVNLTKIYSLKTSIINQLRGRVEKVNAVNDVSLEIAGNEMIALVGESGCGKTTLARMLLHIEPITSGKILIDGEDFSVLDKNRRVEFRKRVQLVFQDPYDSLDPRYRVQDILAEPLKNLNLLPKDKDQLKQIIHKALAQVDLNPPEEFINRYPYQLSGGQRQRVAIARALIVKPEFLVADEPVSMLDVSIRAGILNLLKKLNEDVHIGCLLITHDLATARYLCDRIAVMYLGEIVEIGLAKDLMTSFVHPYSHLLTSSAPDLLWDEDLTQRPKIPTTAMDAIRLPEGCKFSPRCPYATKFCREEKPRLLNKSENHFVACHYHDKPQ